MCGISGIVSSDKLSDELKHAVSQMNRAQAHRGPDGAGEFYADQVALAMRRLAIIDLEGGGQPLFNEDKSVVLIVNGEIYNYVELKNRLQSRGHQFQTGSDCEVIVHLYEEYEENFVSHLRGMFALALWDVKKRRLILARDRMGEKPLYIYEREKQIIFASELKGLLHSGIVPFELEPHAVNLYFHYQYVPEPLTPLKDVRKLDAAQMLIVDAETWSIEEKTYWRMEDAPPLDGAPPEIIREKLEEVGKIIVRSDVPVGVALSGGLDSSIVAALVNKKTSHLSAYSVGYAGRPECDERKDAEVLAKQLKLPFYEIELNTQAIVEFFPQLNYLRDDPVADIAGFGYYAVMKLARENNVPVLLQGQGGDELFWGYQQLRDAARENRLRAALQNSPFSQAIRQAFTPQLPNHRAMRDALRWGRDFGGFRAGWRSVKERRKNADRLSFYEQNSDFAFASAHIKNFYHSDFSNQIRFEAADFHFSSNTPKTMEIALTKMVCDTYLRANGIVQGDRLGMASSVEMRLPLIDYELVETIIGLRKSQPDSHLPPKQWLREAVKDLLPEWIFNRPKRGFAPPTGEWLKAIFSAYGNSLNNGLLVQSNILNGDGAAKLARNEFSDETASPLSFKALVLEQWCRRMSDINQTDVF